MAVVLIEKACFTHCMGRILILHIILTWFKEAVQHGIELIGDGDCFVYPSLVIIISAPGEQTILYNVT